MGATLQRQRIIMAACAVSLPAVPKLANTNITQPHTAHATKKNQKSSERKKPPSIRTHTHIHKIELFWLNEMIIKFEKFRFGSNYGRTRSEYQMTCLEFVFHLLVLVWHSFTVYFFFGYRSCADSRCTARNRIEKSWRELKPQNLDTTRKSSHFVRAKLLLFLSSMIHNKLFCCHLEYIRDAQMKYLWLLFN